jgi:hypothetical protein
MNRTRTETHPCLGALLLLLADQVYEVVDDLVAFVAKLPRPEHCQQRFSDVHDVFHRLRPSLASVQPLLLAQSV